MTLVEWNGSPETAWPFIGAFTKATYVFGPERRRGYVDNRDLPGLFKYVEGNAPVFKAV